MSNLFDQAVAVVLKHEGGYVNDPKDPGGETKFGISKRAYPNVDIKNLTVEDAKGIYYRDYWLKNSLDKLNDAEVAAAVLDTLVNHGRGGFLVQAALQDAGVPISPDGKVGPQTVRSLNTVPAKIYLKALVRRRAEYYDELVRRNPSLSKFLKGWYSRIQTWGNVAATGGGMAIFAVALVAFYIAKKKNFI